GRGEQGMLELPSEIASEKTLREQVLEAHRTLMELSHDNHDMFKDLVNALEQEQVQDEEAAPGIRRAV
ncbi:MAG: hypothetical protein O3B72_11820, partial [Proteobacteria bacterium]|nr:hypothetical protein [Pseudomonadota bacterium]